MLESIMGSDAQLFVLTDFYNYTERRKLCLCVFVCNGYGRVSVTMQLVPLYKIEVSFTGSNKN